MAYWGLSLVADNPFISSAQKYIDEQQRDPAEPDNPFASAAQDVKDEVISTAAASIIAQQEVSPDAYAGARALAKDMDIPVFLAEQDPKRARSMALAKQAQDFVSQNPNVSNFLRNPENAKLVHDDLVALRRVGELLSSFKRQEQAKGILETAGGMAAAIPKSFQAGGADIARTYVETGAADALARMEVGQAAAAQQSSNAFWKLFGVDFDTPAINVEDFRVDPEGEFAKSLAETSDKYADELAYIREKTTSGFWTETAFGIVTGTAQMVPAVAASVLTGSPAVGLAIVGTQAFGSRYSEARRRGFGIQAATAEAAFFAAVEVVSERIPLASFLEGGTGVRGVLKSMGLEGLQEAFVEYINIGYDLAILDQDMTVLEAMERLSQNGIIGAGVGGSIKSGVAGIQRAAQAILPDPKASEYETSVRELKSAVDEAKTTARDPAVMREALTEMADDATVLVSADEMIELMQDGSLTSEQLLAAGLGEQLAEAMQLSGDVTVPVADLLLLDENTFDLIAPSIRRTINSDTAREAQVKLTEREETVTRLLEEMRSAADENQQRPVYGEVYRQLEQTGRYSESEIDRVAALFAENYEARAANTTKTAEELFLEDNVTIRTGRAGERRPATTLEQAQQGFADPRIPELEQAARDRSEGRITQEEYQAVVDQYKPVLPYESVPEPATDAEMRGALASNKVGRLGKGLEFIGKAVGLRLDIPAYTQKGVWVPTIHNPQGKPVAHEAAARITSATFTEPGDAAERAAGRVGRGEKGKAPFAQINGTLESVDPAELKAAADAALTDPAWTQVGYDPRRHTFFYDRKTQQPVLSADEVIQVGPLVLAKNAQFGDAGTFLFQEGLTAEEKRQTKQDERVADKNSHGLMPYLRDYSDAEPRRDKKQALGQTTTNNNARKQLAQVDEILALNPDAHTSVEAWLQMMADAYGVQDVPIAPYRFIEEINGQGSIDNLARLSEGQIEDADHGFENAAAFREAYTSGQLGVETTAKLFLWSFLSRGVSPYTQEGLFIDAFPGIDPWVAQAAAGNLDVEAYSEWVKSVAPKGSGQPGAGATHNLNAFGRDFLVKMSQDVGDGTGRSRLQYIHDLMADPNSTGQQVRREFAAVGEGVGIDNKVVSFTLLVAGFDDVLVLDRVQFRQMYNDGRFDGVNLYDGFKLEGRAVTGSGFAKQGDGARGILIYEAMERSVSARIDEIYSALGREGQGSVGRYHWETWVADSQQEASHGSLGAILPSALGDNTAIHKVSAKQGEYGSYAYGARYGVDGSGIGYFTYPTPSGTVWLFTVDEFVEFQQEVKKAGNGVVPTKFKVTEAGNAPWYNNNEAVNVEALDQLAERVGSGKAGDGAGTLFQDGADQLISDGLPADTAVQQEDREGVSARGSYLNERDQYGNLSNLITLFDGADLTTILHEGGHFWLYQLQQDLNSDYLTEQGRARLQKHWETTKGWFRANSKDAWRDYQKLHKSAQAAAKRNPDDADLQRRAELFERGLQTAKANGGAAYMEQVADNFMTNQMQDAAILEVAFHEYWARGVEMYLGEGRAPSSALRSAFASFTAWMTGIYKNLSALNVNLSDDMRNVFDRMLATEEAINEQRQREAFKIPPDVRELANEAELAELEKLAREAELEAQQQMQQVVAEEIAAMNTAEQKAARAKATEEITEQVHKEPIHALLRIVRRGILPDGTTLDEKPKLFRDDFVKVYGVDAARKVPRGLFTRDPEKAVEPGELAVLSGFGNTQDMITALTSPQRKTEEVIKQRVGARMDQQFSEIMSPDRVADMAAQVVLNEKQVELTELQARILQRKSRETLRQAAQRRAVEEGAPAAAVDRERIEDVERAAGAAPTAADAIPEQLSTTAAAAQREANIPQRRAQSAARRTLQGIFRNLDKGAIDAAAERFVNASKYRDLTPQRYIAAADRLSRKAIRAIASRDYDNAMVYLEQKALNLAIAKRANDAQRKGDNKVKALKRRLTRSDKKLGAAYDFKLATLAKLIAYRVQIIPGQPQVDITAALGEARDAFATDAAFKEFKEQVNDLVALAADYPNGYRDMPYEQFEQIINELTTILSDARSARSMLIEGQRIQHEVIVSQMAAQTSDRSKLNAKEMGRGSAQQRDQIALRGTLRTAIRRVESYMRMLDDGQGDGPFTTYVVKPVFDALNDYYSNRRAPLEAMLELLKPVAGSLKASGPINAPELDGYVFQSKAELLHAILHTGNASNKQKLLRAGQKDVNTGRVYRWSKTSDPKEPTDTSQWDTFMARMFAEGVVTKADMDLVQGIWDIFEDTKGAAQKAHYRMYGFYFSTIEATPVETPFGTYRGGYAPAVTDKMMDIQGGARIDADNLASQQNASMFPSAEAGFTKGRVEAYAQPLDLDLTTIPAHFDRVMKFAYLGPAVRDVAKLTTSRQFREMMAKFDPSAVDGLIIPWLQRTVRQTLVTKDATARPFRILSTLSNRVGLQVMAGNLVNAAQQITGLSSAAVILPPSLIAKNLAHFTEGGQSVWEFISEASPYMEVRFRNGTSDIMEQVENILTEDKPLKMLQAQATKYGYIAQQLAQNIVDPIVWMAAYDHAQENGIWQRAYDAHVHLGADVAETKAKAAAAYYADSVIRQTQSPMGPQDVSRVETGTPLARMFIKFYSYFNNMYNLIVSEFDIIARQIGWKGKPGKFFYLYLAGIAAPAIIANAVSQLARGDFEDDEELDMALLDLFVLSQIKFVAGFIPGGSAAISRVIGEFTPQTYDDRLSFSPVIGIADQAVRGVFEVTTDFYSVVVEGEDLGDRRPASRTIRDGLNAFGVFLGLPTGWFAKPVSFLQRIEEGEEDPEGVADYVRGFLTGRSK
jgi:hypothetical protein